MRETKGKPFYLRWLCVAFTHSFGISDLAGAIIGLIVYFVSEAFGTPTVDVNLWIVGGIFGGIVLVRLILAPYWIYKNIEKERNELLDATSQNGAVVVKQPPQLIIGIHDIEFGLSGDSGYPPSDSNAHKARWLRLGIAFKGNVRIETLGLVISGKDPIPAYEWKPGQGAYYYYFQIPNWVESKEERTIQVQAFANGVTWGSPEMSINFP